MNTKQLIIAVINEDLRTFKAGVEELLEQRIDEAVEKLKKETIAEMGFKCRKEQQVVEQEDDLCEDEECCEEEQCEELEEQHAIEQQATEPVQVCCEEQTIETIEEQVDNDQDSDSEDQEDLEDRAEDGDTVEGNEVTIYADDDVEVECTCTKKTKKAEDDADDEKAKSEEDVSAEVRSELNKSEQEDEQ